MLISLGRRITAKRKSKFRFIFKTKLYKKGHRFNDISKFTVKKKQIRIKVNYIFEEYFLSRSSFARNYTFCKCSVTSALKLVFPTKHFPNLGKTD